MAEVYSSEEEKPEGGFLETLIFASPVLIFIAACCLGYLLFSMAE